MSLKEQLANDLKDAIRQRDEARKNAIRMSTWAIKNAEVEKGAALSDADVLGLLGKQVKQRRESIREFEKADRQDLVAKEQAELTVLQAYLPPQMSREEIAQAAREVIDELGASGPGDKGKVMPVLIKRLAGRAEGREINEV
ncbi:MAG: GatB/YqeY domain-containing protein, partial [Dehalococcoidia bacterium]